MTDSQNLNKETAAAVHPAVERVGLLRQWMLERGYAALIVPTADPHGSEYLPETPNVYKSRKNASSHR